MLPPSPPNAPGYAGNQDPASSTSDFNTLDAIIKSALTKVRTAGLAKVLSVTSAGELAVAGTLSAQLMVNQVDGYGNPTAHGPIYNLIYSRWQGGGNAIIMDPVVGDIGLLVICDRDISLVKQTKDVSNPGTQAMFDLADGVYFPVGLNGVPTQYIRFFSTGIEVVSTIGTVALTDKAGSSIIANGDGTGTMTFADGLTINANVTVNGTVMATGEGTFNGGHTVSAHTHTQGDDSHGDTEVPTDAPTG